MDTIDSILDAYPDEEFIQLDGFDEAILGVEENKMALIYSVTQCIDILAKDMDWQDARDYFDFNIRAGHYGERSPIFCDDYFL